MKKDFFRLQEHGTTAKREVLAGITTFMTMAYVLAVQPAAICGFGPDPVFTDVNGLVISKSALLVMCALVSGAITLFMGLYANLPLALSTAMGSNFILGGLVNSGAFSFGWAMALLLCSGILFILVTVLGVRKMVVDLLPKNLKIAIPTAVGFFIAYLGFKNTGLAVFSNGLALGDFSQPTVLLALITMVVMGVLTAYKVRGAILIGIVVGTVISIPMGVSTLPASVFSLPDVSELGNLFLCYDFKSILADIPGALVWIFILFTSDFFATFGALIAVGAQTNMLDEEGNFPHIEKPFLVDAVGTVVGSATGCTTISTFIESTIGVEAGGRTGLTAVVTSILFFVCVFLSPLFLMIPTSVTGVALIFVGFSMLSGFTKLDFSDFKSCFGPFVMIMFGTFTGDIAASICLGVLTDVLIKVVTGDAKKVHPVLYVLCIPLVLYFIVWGGRAYEIRRSHCQADAGGKGGAHVRTGFLAHEGRGTARHSVRDDDGRAARPAQAGERFGRAGPWPLRSGDVLSDGERACEQLGRNAALCRWPRARRGGRGAGRRHGARTGREHQAQPALRAEL